MTAKTIVTTRLDIMGEATAADPWPLLQALREQGPVVWHETYGRWMVTTDREVRNIVADYRRFTVEDTTVADLFGAEAFISIDDRARHDALRLVWAEAFRKSAVERLGARITGFADDLLAPVAERLRAGEPVELAAACRSLPTLVIALMMGVSDDMLPSVVRWSDAMAAGGSAYLGEAERALAVEAREAAKTALADYLLELLAWRRRQPGDDLISVMVRAEAAQGLTDAALVQNVRQLLFAGNETTAKWLANILVVLGERPGLQRELAADRALVPLANDEVMRWQGVVGSLVRRVRGGPIEVAGVELAEGDAVTLLLASANRDAARYERPEVFDIHRPPQPNLGFGVGLHNCLGVNLAKLEAEILVNRMLDTLPAFTVAAAYRFSSLPMRGPLPVTLGRDA